MDAYDAGCAVQRERFPDFASATRATVTLTPGDVLYTPPFFWHHVRSIAGDDEGEGEGEGDDGVNGVVVSVLVPFDLAPHEAKHMCHYV